MTPHSLPRRLVAATVVAAFSSSPVSGQLVKVINIIPTKYSGEALNNPEPNIAIKSKAADSIVVTAHLPDSKWCKYNTMSGYFAATSGGGTWRLVCAPALVSTPVSQPGDLTARFSGNADWLHISNLLPGDGLHLLGTKLMTSGNSAVDILDGTLGSTINMDQPQLRTRPKPGEKEISIAVSDHDFTPTTSVGLPCQYARFLWAKETMDPVSLRSECINTRNSDYPPSIRVAVHPEGVTYVLYFRLRWVTNPTTGIDDAIADPVIVRGHPSASTGYSLNALAEPGALTSDPCAPSDGQLGIRIVRCVNVPWDDHNAAFGWELRRGTLALAVDPTDSNKVYAGWGDDTPNPLQTIHVRRSVDGGKTWPPEDLFQVAPAANPALAVDDVGRVALLYQQYDSSDGGRWLTRLRWTGTSQTLGNDIILANTPAGTTLPPVSPYQGDYADLVAIGHRFYGVFSARNDPKAVVFPYGVTYQRKCSGGFLRRAGGGAVKPSVDPFFFIVQPEGITSPVVGSGLAC